MRRDGSRGLRALDEPISAPEVLCEHPVGVLLESLCAWWRGLEVDSERRHTAIERAKTCGWNLLVDELECGAKGEGLFSFRSVRSDRSRLFKASCTRPRASSRRLTIP